MVTTMNTLVPDTVFEIIRWAMAEPSPHYRLGEVCCAFDMAVGRIISAMTIPDIISARAIGRYLRGGDILNFVGHKRHLTVEQLYALLDKMDNAEETYYKPYISGDEFVSMITSRPDLASAAVKWRSKNGDVPVIISRPNMQYSVDSRLSIYNHIVAGGWSSFMRRVIDTTFDGNCRFARRTLCEDFIDFIINLALARDELNYIDVMALLIEMDKEGAFCQCIDTANNHAGRRHREPHRHIGERTTEGREPRAAGPPSNVGRPVFSDRIYNNLMEYAPHSMRIVAAYNRVKCRVLDKK